MYDSIKVNYPDEVLNGMNFEKNIFSIIETDLMISTFSEFDDSCNILRIYQLLYNHFNKNYEFVQELAAFSFVERSELVYFLNGLPKLSGLEMLMLMNPVDHNKRILN